MNQLRTQTRVAFAIKFALATVGFSALLATKDILFRSLALKGMSAGQLLFLVGMGCGAALSASMAMTRSSLQLKSLRLQLLRFIVAGLSGFLIAKAFQVLNASAVSMVSKIYIPLLLLVSPLIGVSYTRKQKSLAFGSIVAIGIFCFLVRSTGQPIVGFVYAISAAVFVMVEYITLRKTTLTENLFWTAFTPAISCMAFGLIEAGTSGIAEIRFLPANEISLGLMAGVILYLIYAVSVYRYRILPIGISEYPSLITALILIPLEFAIFGWKPEMSYVFCLVLTTGLMGMTIYFRDQRPILIGTTG